MHDRKAIQNNAILLIVLGLLCGGTLPAIFGIIALVQLDTNPSSAQTMNKVGWIIFWVTLGLIVLFFVFYIVVFVLIMGVATIPAITGG